jgi:uncharacterized membrane protein YccC
MGSKRDDIEQILQSCLELIGTGQETVDSALARYPEKAEELRPLLETSSWLHEQREAIAPRPDFVAQSRQRLVARLEREKSGNYAQAPPSGLLTLWSSLASLFTQKRFAYQFALATFLLIFLVASTSGVAFASQWTIPGDTLYPVKTSLERVQLALSLSEARRAQLHITFAERRLVEIQNLVMESRFEYLHSAVDAFEAQATQATRLLHSLDQKNSERAMQLASQLRRIVGEQAAVLPVLVQLSPAESWAEIQRLETLVTAIVDDIGDIEATPRGTLTQTPTATPSSPTPASPTVSSPPAVGTPTVAASPLPSATPDPLLTPTPPLTPVTSSTPVVTTGTPMPTTVSGSNQPVPTTVSEDVPPPKKTKKPHPNPPRRPPKPPKTNSSNK